MPFISELVGKPVADIDGDSILEIIVGCRDSLYAFKPDSSRVPGWPVYISGTPSYPAIGDIDTSYDGLETAIHTDAGWTYVFNADGSLANGWPQSCPTCLWCIMSAPVLGDVNGDGNIEIVLAGNDCFYVWTKDGADLPGWPIRLPTMNNVSLATPLIGDVDGDDDMEVIGITHMGDVYVFEADASIVLGFPILGSGRVDGTPTLKDIDFDGKNDIVMTTRDYEVRVWEVLGTKTEWGELANDRWHTGLYGFVPYDTLNLSISEEFKPGILKFKLCDILPNPFTKTANISFLIPANSKGNLTIHDISGRVVKQFNDLTSKDSPVKWNAENMSSGIFFVSLESVNSIDSSACRVVEKKKIILIK